MSAAVSDEFPSTLHNGTGAVDTPLTSDNRPGTCENGRAGTVAPTTARPLISTTTSTREVRA